LQKELDKAAKKEKQEQVQKLKEQLKELKSPKKIVTKITPKEKSDDDDEDDRSDSELGLPLNQSANKKDVGKGKEKLQKTKKGEREDKGRPYFEMVHVHRKILEIDT
jgi:hypothetical protein